MQTLSNIWQWLIQPHPQEAQTGDLWFQEEARGERVLNVARLGWWLTWTLSVVAFTNVHPFTANLVNISIGLGLLFCSMLYIVYLHSNPYRAWMKYVSTGLEIFAITVDLFVFQFEMTYATTLKAPAFIAYILILVAASMRFNLKLLVFATSFIVVLYSGLLSYILLTYPVEYGDAIVDFTTGKISMVYQGYKLMFIIATGFFTYLLVLSIRRLVQLREDEAQRRGLLERYFSPDIASYLLQHPEGLAAHEVQATVMMTDLRNFTAFSERVGVSESVRVLNEIFEAQVEILFNYGGTLDKFLGDGMLAGFGVPQPQIDSAQHAVQAAIEMVRVVQNIGSVHGLDLGVAIHEGLVYFGNVGSPHRLELTMMGDTVNTASRMEPMNKTYDKNILISEAVQQKIPDGFDVSFVDQVVLRGKEVEIKLYSVKA